MRFGIEITNWWQVAAILFIGLPVVSFCAGFGRGLAVAVYNCQ